MRIVIKNVILVSLLLSTALLTAWSGHAASLYFPHVATTDSWQTEIAIINTGDQPVTGTLTARRSDGGLVEARDIPLSARGRRQITVASEFTDHAAIRYFVFDTASAAVQGYTKFFQAGKYRAAIPAVKEVNTSDIYIPHIASTAEWWTGISLVNTTSAPKVLTIAFKRVQGSSESRQITLAANQHKAFDIAVEFFNNQPQPDIESAVITNASGIVGLELFGTYNDKQLEGILLTDKTTPTIYYPHVAGGEWWTGIVAYNPSVSECRITIRPYKADGSILSSRELSIPGKGKYIGQVSALSLPADTAWFKIDSTSPITGFELFSTLDGAQLGAYAEGSGSGAKAGVFAKIEKDGGWTGVAFVNTEAAPASVTLTAYADAGGAPIATQPLTVGGYAKVVNFAEAIFSQSIGNATYISYVSDKNVVGFQLNSSSDEKMLDGLPGLAGGGNVPAVYASFAGSGLYAWNGSTWTQINLTVPAGMAASESTLYASFAGAGLHAWNGSTWTQINATVPADMAASESTLYASFTGSGLYAWNGSTWTQINPTVPAGMAASESTLYASFAGAGLHAWNGSTWTQINPTVPAGMAGSGSMLYASFAGAGLHAWNGSTWTQINATTPAFVVAGF